MSSCIAGAVPFAHIEVDTLGSRLRVRLHDLLLLLRRECRLQSSPAASAWACWSVSWQAGRQRGLQRAERALSHLGVRRVPGGKFDPESSAIHPEDEAVACCFCGFKGSKVMASTQVVPRNGRGWLQTTCSSPPAPWESHRCANALRTRKSGRHRAYSDADAAFF